MRVAFRFEPVRGPQTLRFRRTDRGPGVGATQMTSDRPWHSVAARLNSDHPGDEREADAGWVVWPLQRVVEVNAEA